MTDPQVAHTSQLSEAALAASRALLDDAFDGDFGDEDWAHTIGGMHVLIREGDDLIGHASVVQRMMLHGERPLRCGYVEGVGVRADRRGRGHGGTLMAACERIVERAYDLGVLSTSEEGTRLYLSRGWRRWQGPTSVLAPEGVVPTPEEDGDVFFWQAGVPLDPTGPLTCDWRGGDVW
ncbi:GNAT family N-acetyltransferase [Streptomycetaceae bacterium NBC_01309]